MPRTDAQKKYYEKNKEKIKERIIAYRKTPEYKEKHRLKMIEYRKNNPEKCKQISDKCRLKNGEKYNALRKEKYNNDPIFKQKKKEQDLRYLQSGKRHEQRKNYRVGREEELRQKVKEWRLANPDKVLNKMRNYRASKWNEIEREKTKNLDTSHIVKLIKKQTKFQIKTEDIPLELIDIKKQSLLLKRTIKKKENGNSTTNL